MPTPAVPERFPTVRAFMGDSAPRELRRDPKTDTCQVCEGEGSLDTGSKVEGQAELPCWNCNGMGWTGERSPSVPTFTPTLAPAAAPANGEPTVAPTNPERERLKAEALKLGMIVLDGAAT